MNVLTRLGRGREGHTANEHRAQPCSVRWSLVSIGDDHGLGKRTRNSPSLDADVKDVASLRDGRIMETFREVFLETRRIEMPTQDEAGITCQQHGIASIAFVSTFEADALDTVSSKFNLGDP